MRLVPTDVSSSFNRRAPQAGLTLLGKAGFVAKGTVYLLAGLLTLRAAVEGGAPRDEHAAVRSVGVQPAGDVMLMVIGVGLGCYALFRLAQAIVGAEADSSRLKHASQRIARFASSLVHGALSVTAFELAGGHHSAGGEHEAQTWAGKLLAQPFGVPLLLAVGIGVAIAGAVQLILAVTASFQRELDLSRASSDERQWTIRLGRIGHAARGVVFAIMGVFAIRAALLSNAAEVEGMAGALRKLQTGPDGVVLLGAVAAGLALYGVFLLVSARHVRPRLC